MFTASRRRKEGSVHHFFVPAVLPPVLDVALPPVLDVALPPVLDVALTPSSLAPSVSREVPMLLPRVSGTLPLINGKNGTSAAVVTPAKILNVPPRPTRARSGGSTRGRRTPPREVPG